MPPTHRPINTAAPRAPEVHGHRGCRGLLPENTLPGFLHAAALGVDVLEMDVVISADHQVVVSHDPWLAAHLCRDAAGHCITPAQERQYNLYQMPYAAIRQCDCGSEPHQGFPAQQPSAAPKPLLREVLAATKALPRPPNCPPLRYSVEIKCTPAGDNHYHPEPAQFLALVAAELVAAGVLARTTLLCFDPRVLRLARAQFGSGLALCLLSENGQPWPTTIAELGFQPDVFGPNYESVTAAAVAELRRLYPGTGLVPWTVNDPADMQRLLAMGVEGLTTDYPDRLLAVLGPSK
ncbi:glycerophosphodiester phosphodiesterase family protein [Hymenobacter nivis]|uniref:Glycerophosphodiester phosphodiesterase n=1 Tax=Hymenobacter nivis TaxID=1850093 RepID=A0A502GPP6_9BACT|nr:glycerophosphodiester phosphodiesterase family protein [Hymenobacter nivis]TPG62976.1 glycerophosphodiester phosphodiesterase [Hymenobacter nivis]